MAEQTLTIQPILEVQETAGGLTYVVPLWFIVAGRSGGNLSAWDVGIVRFFLPPVPIKKATLRIGGGEYMGFGGPVPVVDFRAATGVIFTDTRTSFTPIEADVTQAVKTAQKLPTLVAGLEGPSLELAAGEPFTLPLSLTLSERPELPAEMVIKAVAREPVSRDSLRKYWSFSLLLELDLEALIKLLLDGSQVWKEAVPRESRTEISVEATMPYDDWTPKAVIMAYNTYTEEWGKVFERDLPTIKAGFPAPVVSVTEKPEWARPGRETRIGFTIQNQGFTGRLRVGVIDTFRREEASGDWVRLISGESVAMAFRGEMPPAESWTLTASPSFVGRHQEVQLGSEAQHRIVATEVVFERTDQGVAWWGMGDGVKVTGFVVGEGLSFSSLNTTPRLERGLEGVYFEGTVPRGDMARLGFTKALFLRWESEKGLALVRNGTLSSKDTTYSEMGLTPISLLISLGIMAPFRVRSRVELVGQRGAGISFVPMSLLEGPPLPRTLGIKWP